MVKILNISLEDGLYQQVVGKANDEDRSVRKMVAILVQRGLGSSASVTSQPVSTFTPAPVPTPAKEEEDDEEEYLYGEDKVNYRLKKHPEYIRASEKRAELSQKWLESTGNERRKAQEKLLAYSAENNELENKLRKQIRKEIEEEEQAKRDAYVPPTPEELAADLVAD